MFVESSQHQTALSYNVDKVVKEASLASGQERASITCPRPAGTHTNMVPHHDYHGIQHAHSKAQAARPPLPNSPTFMKEASARYRSLACCSGSFQALTHSSALPLREGSSVAASPRLLLANSTVTSSTTYWLAGVGQLAYRPSSACSFSSARS